MGLVWTLERVAGSDNAERRVCKGVCIGKSIYSWIMWSVTVMWRLESGQRPLLHHKSVLCKHTLMECKQLRGVPTKRKWALTLLDLQTVIDYYANSSSHDDLLVFVSQLLTGFFCPHETGRVNSFWWQITPWLQENHVENLFIIIKWRLPLLSPKP